MKTVLRSTSFLGTILLGSLLATTASAQEDTGEDTGSGASDGQSAEVASDPRADARARFGEGVEAMGRSDWELAATKFEEALALYPAPSIEYNLASAYYELGRMGPAGDLVASVLANPETDATLSEAAHVLEAQIAAGGGTLTVEVVGDDAAGATVSVDDYPLPPERVGVERSESLGAHVIVLRRADGSVEEQQVTVAPGTPARATFGPALAGPADAPGDGGGLTTNPFFWTLIGVGAAVVIGVIIAVAVTSGGNEVGGDYQPAVLRF